jgi:ABC-2 type transport system permease protein
MQRQITYRAATLAGLATNFFFGLLRASVMIALFGARNQVEGMSIQAAITYTALAQASIAYLALFGWYDLMSSVYTGQISADLLKPMNHFTFWMAQDLGRAVVNFVLRGVTILLFYGFFFDILLPSSISQILALMVSIILAWLISFSYRYLINLPAFWSPNALGFIRLGFGISWILSGFLMPLQFFPDWFERLSYLTPFPHMINTPIDIYLGLLTPTQVLNALVVQAGWIGLLFTTGQLVMRRGIRRLVIQGG